MRRFAQPLLPLLVGLLTIISPAGFSEPLQPAPAKILFLTFSIKNDGTISLKNSILVPGTLKKRKIDNDGEILYEVTKKGTGTILRGALRSPLVRYFDYADPNNPTVLKGGMVADSVAEFTVRVPYQADLSKISFFKKADIPDSGPGKVPVTAAFPKGKLLGSFAIPKQGGAK